MCVSLATALRLPLPVQAQTEKQPEWTPEEKEFAEKAAKLNREGTQLYRMGKAAAAVEKLAAVLEIRLKAVPQGVLQGRPSLPGSQPQQYGRCPLCVGRSGQGVDLLRATAWPCTRSSTPRNVPQWTSRPGHQPQRAWAMYWIHWEKRARRRPTPSKRWPCVRSSTPRNASRTAIPPWQAASTIWALSYNRWEKRARR